LKFFQQEWEKVIIKKQNEIKIKIARRTRLKIIGHLTAIQPKIFKTQKEETVSTYCITDFFEKSTAVNKGEREDVIFWIVSWMQHH